MEPVELPCGEAERFQLTASALAALDPAPQGVILASPANPTGTIIPREELAAIAEVCRARGITIISDEIYHGISYGMDAPRSSRSSRRRWWSTASPSISAWPAGGSAGWSCRPAVSTRRGRGWGTCS
jgi:aspartate/methionine/tyrosine aminotransferase